MLAIDKRGDEGTHYPEHNQGKSYADRWPYRLANTMLKTRRSPHAPEAV